jgi:hypothetical protein
MPQKLILDELATEICNSKEKQFLILKLRKSARKRNICFPKKASVVMDMNLHDN